MIRTLSGTQFRNGSRFDFREVGLLLLLLLSLLKNGRIKPGLVEGSLIFILTIHGHKLQEMIGEKASKRN